MSRLLFTVLVVLVACGAHAGGNPDVRVYFDFDPPNYAHSIEPEVYTAVNAYLCLDQIGEGVTSVAFRLSDPMQDCPGVFAARSWIHNWDHPGFGSPFDEPGAAPFSWGCMHWDPNVVGYISLFYLGGECCLRILDHTDHPRWVFDCGDPIDVDFYCVLAHGSIGGADCPDGDCEGVPVQDDTWGTIKSLYR